MKLRLPDFSTSYCTFLSLCGTLKDASAASKESFFNAGGDRLDWTTTYSKSGTKVFLRLLGFPRIPGIHFHIDLSPASAFTGGTPHRTHTLKAFQEKLSALEDHKLDVVTIASWTVPSDQVAADRKYPWASEIRVVSGALSMTLIGAEFEITGGGIKRFQWSWEGDETEDSASNLLLETLSVRHQRKLTVDYIAEELAEAEDTLRTAILRESRRIDRGAS